MEYTRTPDERFENLAGFNYKPHYLQNNGLRMAYIDEQVGSGEEVFLCLHGEPTWSYLYRKMIPVFLNYPPSGTKEGLSRRVVAPDLLGFGRSDKPSDDASYNFDFHRDSLLHLIESLDLTNITLVVQDWGGVLGLTLPITAPARFKRLVVMNTILSTGKENSQGIQDWVAYTSSLSHPDAADLIAVLGHELSEEEQRAYRAPFPSDAATNGIRVFPQMVMRTEDMPGVQISLESRRFFQTTDRFRQEDVFVAAGMRDPILGPQMRPLAEVFKHGCYYTELEEATHFVQEWGDKVAKLALQVFEKQGSITGVEKIEPAKA